MRYVSFFALTLLLAISCSDPVPKTFKDCTFGEPQPIFSENLTGVKTHKFTLNKLDAREEVFFENGKELVINQSGCDHIKQEFLFNIIKEIPDNFPAWVDRATDEFFQLSELSEKHATLGIWATFIKNNKNDLKQGESLEIQPGYFVKIDRIKSKDNGLLIVELLNK